MQVRLSSAYYLLEINEDIACNTLKDIANKNLNHISTSAATILERWSSGELKIYFGKE
jgi:flagellar motor switch protein FliG